MLPALEPALAASANWFFCGVKINLLVVSSSLKVETPLIAGRVVTNWLVNLFWYLLSFTPILLLVIDNEFESKFMLRPPLSFDIHPVDFNFTSKLLSLSFSKLVLSTPLIKYVWYKPLESFDIPPLVFNFTLNPVLSAIKPDWFTELTFFNLSCNLFWSNSIVSTS